MGDLMTDNDDFPTEPKSSGCREMCRPSTGCVATTLIGGAFSIVQITVGAVFLYECPLGPFIPVYVLVSGVVTLVLVTPWGMPWLLKKDGMGRGGDDDFWKFLTSILAIFLFFWFFIGSFPIYSMFPPNYDKNLTAENYRHYSLTQSHRGGVPSKSTGELHLGAGGEDQTLSNSSRHGQTWSTDYNQTGASSNQTARVLPYCDRTLYLFAFWTTTLVYISPVLVCVCVCVRSVIRSEPKRVK